MPATAAEAFRAWHDFYVLLCTASATLIGATFVVASIGSRFMNEDGLPLIGAFITSTVVHLSVVVCACAVLVVPSLEWRWLGGFFGLVGLAGITYCSVVGRHVLRGRVHWTDPVWYGLVPTVAYAVLLAEGLSVLLDGPPWFEAVAVTPALLLITGIRNAWDMIIFFATREDRTT